MVCLSKLQISICLVKVVNCVVTIGRGWVLINLSDVPEKSMVCDMIIQKLNTFEKMCLSLLDAEYMVILSKLLIVTLR